MRLTIAVNERGNRVGQSHHNARLTDYEVDMIRQLHFAAKMSYPRIAEKFEVSAHTVKDICLFRRRAEVPARWKVIEVVA